MTLGYEVVQGSTWQTDSSFEKPTPMMPVPTVVSVARPICCFVSEILPMVRTSVKKLPVEPVPST